MKAANTVATICTGNADEPKFQRDNGMCHTHECRSWRDLNVVTQFQILHERRGSCQSLHGIRFEQHVRKRLPRKQSPRNDLRKDIQRDLQ